MKISNEYYVAIINTDLKVNKIKSKVKSILDDRYNYIPMLNSWDGPWGCTPAAIK